MPFRGIIPPLVTPLSGLDELDCPGLERLVEHVLTGVGAWRIHPGNYRRRAKP